jgi:hypothetical protein
MRASKWGEPGEVWEVEVLLGCSDYRSDSVALSSVREAGAKVAEDFDVQLVKCWVVRDTAGFNFVSRRAIGGAGVAEQIVYELGWAGVSANVMFQQTVELQRSAPIIERPDEAQNAEERGLSVMDSDREQTLRERWRKAQRSPDNVQMQIEVEIERLLAEELGPKVWEIEVFVTVSKRVARSTARDVGDKVAAEFGAYLANCWVDRSTAQFRFLQSNRPSTAAGVASLIVNEFGRRGVSARLKIAPTVDRRGQEGSLEGSLEGELDATEWVEGREDPCDDDQQSGLDQLEVGMSRDAPWYDQDDPDVTREQMHQRWLDGGPPW